MTLTQRGCPYGTSTPRSCKDGYRGLMLLWSTSVAEEWQNVAGLSHIYVRKARKSGWPSVLENDSPLVDHL